MTDLGSLAALSAVAFVAALVNGAIGYGFSSTTVPIALLFMASRLLNPALVLAEIPMNVYLLAVNRRSVRVVLPRAMPVIVGVVPGAVVGTLILAAVSADLIKLYTYLAILPLILIQVAGIRRPMRAERAIGIPFGVGVGILYSTTTISGPPLALFLNNQGLSKADFRAALGAIRTAESLITGATFFLLGLFVPSVFALVLWVAPSIAIGIPLGALLMRRIDPETFRRVCMSFDAAIVAFGLARVVDEITPWRGAAYAIIPFVLAIDAALLYRSYAARQVAAST